MFVLLTKHRSTNKCQAICTAHVQQLTTQNLTQTDMQTQPATHTHTHAHARTHAHSAHRHAHLQHLHCRATALWRGGQRASGDGFDVHGVLHCHAHLCTYKPQPRNQRSDAPRPTRAHRSTTYSYPLPKRRASHLHREAAERALASRKIDDGAHVTHDKAAARTLAPAPQTHQRRTPFKLANSLYPVAMSRSASHAARASDVSPAQPDTDAAAATTRLWACGQPRGATRPRRTHGSSDKEGSARRAQPRRNDTFQTGANVHRGHHGHGRGFGTTGKNDSSND